jgi:3-hydroxyacyl-[acyl-carrier-protein] dehydratase
MKFELVDAVLSQDETSITTLKQVSLSEEYLQDHFPGFPVLPGVFMLEAMVQAGRRVLQARDAAAGGHKRYVLGAVRAVKYGAFVRPGYSLRVTVTLSKVDEGSGAVEFKGQAVLLAPGGGAVRDANNEEEVAFGGRFTLRELKL